jgi:hypothetical protein
MKKKLTIAACLLFFLSRIFFINTKPIFFDSAGYLKAFSYPSLFDAIVAVHFPLHDGYIILFWPFYHVARFFSLNPSLAVIVAQVGFALLTVILFYKIIVFLVDERTAWLASIFVSLMPLFWITNGAIMYEIGYIGLFIASVFFLVQFCKRKKFLFLNISALLYCFAFFTHAMVILWLPLYFAIAFYKARKDFLRVVFIVLVYLFGLSMLRKYSMDALGHGNLVYTFNGFQFGTFSNAGANLRGLAVDLRNFFIPTMRSVTSLIALLGFISLGWLFIKNKQYFVYGFFWIMPAFVALQFWEAELPGRYGSLDVFGFAFLAALLLKKQTFFAVIVACYMLLVTIPAVNLLRGDVPYIKLAEATAALPKDSLLIDSHFSRRQIQDVYKGVLFSVNEPNTGRDTITGKIDQYLKNKKDVYIVSPALTDPYGLYAGPYLHALTLSYAKPAEMQSVIGNYTLVPYKVVSADDAIVIYKIVSKSKHSPPIVKSLKDHYRRIDYYDPLWWIYKFVFNKILGAYS